MGNGKLGILVVVLALLFSIFGGFLLNAEDKTVCTTDYEYITDVSGAFSGSGSDIKVDYDPETNVTGYSVFSPLSTETTTNTIHGINYTTTNANGYWIQENKGNTSSKALIITNNKSPTSNTSGQAAVDVDGTTQNVTIEKEWGLYNSEVKTQMTISNYTFYRVAGISMASLMDAIGVLDTDNAYISVSNPTNDYPCFIANAGFNVHMEGSGTDRYVANEVTYTDAGWQIKLDPSTNTVILNGSPYSYSDITFVWGTATNLSANATLLIGATSETKYINPVNGVQPTSVHSTHTVVTQTTSKATTITGEIKVTQGGWSDGTVSVTIDGGSTSQLFRYEVRNQPGNIILFMINGSWKIPASTTTDLTLYYKFSMDDFDWVYLWYNKSMTEPYSERIYVGVIPTGAASIDGVNATMEHHQSGTASNTITDNTHNTSSTGSGNVYLNTVVTTTQSETITDEFTTTYWANGYKNTKLAMLVKAPSIPLENEYVFNYALKGGNYHADTITLNYDGNTWYVSLNELDALNVGKWPGIMLNMEIISGVPFYYIEPVSNFVTFQDYVRLGNSYQIVDPTWSIDNYQAISMDYITFDDTDSQYMYHEIIKTTVLLSGGGLYIQDGRFSPSTSFPNDLINQFRVMSAAHVGDSMTVTTSEGTSLTIYSNGFDGWIIDGKKYNYSDVSIFYVDANIPTVDIGGHIYDAGIYYNGSIYEKGHLYIQYNKMASLVDLGPSTNDYVITLDGTWAVSTAYYVGNNVGKQTTELSTPGEWHWDKEEFLIVFLGTILVGSIIASWRLGMRAYDWIAVICSAVVVFLMVG